MPRVCDVQLSSWPALRQVSLFSNDCQAEHVTLMRMVCGPVSLSLHHVRGYVATFCTCESDSATVKVQKCSILLYVLLHVSATETVWLPLTFRISRGPWSLSLSPLFFSV